MSGKRSIFLTSALCFGFAFLYVPILLVIIYSFNEGKLVTVWAGFSTKWYVELFQDDGMIDAAWNSLRIGVMSATLALAIGTPAGLVMSRFGRFKTRTMFSGMIAAPLVMPDVITGLSLLLLFVTMEQLIGWPEGRGMTTIVIAHTTFCAAYVAVVIQSRLAGMDSSIEEAAMDLGAKPTKIFFLITLPMILPALMAGWLLSFTLSLDDLVISSFVAGPGSTTLPMKVFSSVRLGVSPEINALATLIIVAISILIIIASILVMRSERQRSRQIQDDPGIVG
ncbi:MULTISPECIES: ABC transporter permease subunit [unclassified Thalassospira]|jgi:putrescine transport system permease protein|uniref:ABC transporter permease subunit n=1 Tax=unclassified Thalassospira TaxID=2648997 RepID=UPI000A1F15B0|nr:ABC transporter permease subunit [Thalassospira sp. MCCC 1A01428]OSQ43411.1 spermidine/putrescine ABC transporter permease [Thalassospira sp. MCCC 1A01428]